MPASPLSPCVPSDFGGITGSELSISHVFPQYALPAISLVEGGAVDGVSRARIRWELEFLLCLVDQHRLVGSRIGSQVAGVETLRIWSELFLFPLSVFSFSSQHPHLTTEVSSSGARGASVITYGVVPAYRLEFQTNPDSTAFMCSRNSCPCPTHVLC